MRMTFHNLTAGCQIMSKQRQGNVLNMWVYQVKNVKLQATAKLFIVAKFYQINPIQNTTKFYRNYRKFIKLSTSHKFKNL